MSVVNSVSSQTNVGGTDDNIKKIYQGETVVYENAHEAIPNNSILNPWWEADTQYPGSAAFQQGEVMWNGHQSESAFASVYTDNWGHYSPLFNNNFDYKSYMGRYYLYRHNTLNPSGSLSSPFNAHEHVDLARTATAFFNESLQFGFGGTAQKRILKLHGAGYAFSPSSMNRDVDRTYPSPTITTCTTDDHPDIDSNLLWQANSDDTRPQKAWYGNQYFQSVTAPDDATQVTFGAYVRCPSDDLFRDLNGGFISFKQIKDGVYPGQQAGKVDNIIFRKSGQSSNWNLKTGSISNLVNSSAQAHFQWSGPQHTSLISARGINQWNDQVEISAHQYEDAEDYSEFKKVSRTVSLDAGTSRIYNFGVGFLESHHYMLAIIMGANPGSGSIDFYNCFVVFS